MPKQYILCVDDDLQVLSSLRQQLSAGLGGGLSYETAESGEEGLELVEELLADGHEIPVVISDQLMPGMKGDEMLVRLNDVIPRTRKILLTGQASAGAVGNALNMANLYRFIAKPWNEQDLLKTVQEAIKSFHNDQKLDQQVRLLTRIANYSLLLQQTLDLDTLVHNLLEALLQDTQCYRAGILLTHPGTLTPAQALMMKNGKPQPQIERLAAQDLAQVLPIGLLSKTILTRDYLYLPYASQDQDWRDDPYINSQRLRTIYSAPLANGDTVVGALYLEHPTQAHRLAEDALDLLAAVGAQATAALRHVQLYQDLERQVQQRTHGIAQDHKDMRDSIHYAQRIQRAILPNWDRALVRLPNSYVYYKPKAIVSGDFYWYEETSKYIFLAAADCTGHGVPGAFMSVLGVMLLNQAVREKGLTDTADILHWLHEALIEQLKQEDDDSEVLDGMDIALLRLDLKAREAQYAGAKRPLLRLREKTLQRFEPSRSPIGGRSAKPLRRQDDGRAIYFEAQTIPYQRGDVFYLFTDGLTDQFDSTNKKKFTAKRLEDLLTLAHHLPTTQQKALIENRLAVWQGEGSQTDDMLLIGLSL